MNVSEVLIAALQMEIVPIPTGLLIVIVNLVFWEMVTIVSDFR
mgnify:CR=1 FL=1